MSETSHQEWRYSDSGVLLKEIDEQFSYDASVKLTDEQDAMYYYLGDGRQDHVNHFHDTELVGVDLYSYSGNSTEIDGYQGATLAWTTKATYDDAGRELTWSYNQGCGASSRSHQYFADGHLRSLSSWSADTCGPGEMGQDTTYLDNGQAVSGDWYNADYSTGWSNNLDSDGRLVESQSSEVEAIRARSIIPWTMPVSWSANTRRRRRSLAKTRRV